MLNQKLNKIYKFKFPCRSSLFVLTLAAVLFGLILFIQPQKTYASPITESKLIQLTNQERQINNLSDLKPDPVLYFAAKAKAQDMLYKDYFEHYSPNNKSPWDFIHNAGYDYQKAGENLAMDFVTSEGIHDAWMQSNTHKANILKSDYEHIAIATITGDFHDRETTVVVQMFGKPTIKNQINSQLLFIKIRNFILGFK